MHFGRKRRYGRYGKLEENQKENKEREESGAQEAAAEAADAAAPETPGKPESPEAQDTPEASGKPAAPEKPAEPDWKDHYARLLADFDNFKKRTARDREDTYRYAEADILNDLLPTVDNLALALNTAKDPSDPFVGGVKLAYDSFLAALKAHGAEPFDSVGETLDTERMEAVAQLPNADFAEGVVSNEVKRGWMLKGKVLRAAQVVVSAGAPAAPAEPAAKEEPAAPGAPEGENG